ncbi:hypothetical protein BLNAU_2804 [Blattamonas nauphoetae]|uniref:Uncharacterized protein n=1 Tax=Blattamonas nauphoetae TaxID=2049346 RepID=A0ABQ9YED5_9EUKA|nr:hypothetical protein BLNAU_2804 [Blattamonas nauphoetae]
MILSSGILPILGNYIESSMLHISEDISVGQRTNAPLPPSVDHLLKDNLPISPRSSLTSSVHSTFQHNEPEQDNTQSFIEPNTDHDLELLHFPKSEHQTLLKSLLTLLSHLSAGTEASNRMILTTLFSNTTSSPVQRFFDVLLFLFEESICDCHTPIIQIFSRLCSHTPCFIPEILRHNVIPRLLLAPSCSSLVTCQVETATLLIDLIVLVYSFAKQHSLQVALHQSPTPPTLLCHLLSFPCVEVVCLLAKSEMERAEVLIQDLVLDGQYYGLLEF